MGSSGYVEKLPASEGRYSLLVNAITDYAIYMLDIHGRITNWNAGARRLKGYDIGEIVGSHFSCFYTPEDRQAGLPERALAHAAAEGKFEKEGWRIRKDGSRFWAHTVIDAIRDADDVLVGYAKITRDLTERKQAEETLRRTEEQFRLLIQSVTDYAIFMLDPQGRISTWNPGAARIKQYHAEEIIGEHFSRFYTEADRAAGAPAKALACAKEEGRFAAEGWRVRKDGTSFRASVVIDPIWDDRGTLIGYAKITRDITERYEAQRDLEKTREALLQSQKTEAIGQLTGGVAHDFNNLLTAILSSLTLLRKRLRDDPQAIRLIDNATQGAQRGAALIQRMLAFARRQDLKSERIDVPSLVSGMTELLQHTLGPAWPIETRFPLSLSAVMADSNQLEMALLNLAVNARDAMPNGGTICVVAQEKTVTKNEVDRLGAGRYVSLAVVDTGSGMDAATLARATEPFFTTKGVGKGTGLGLSMVYGLAEQMGGTFLLVSEPGAGTKAELWLPLAPPVPRPERIHEPQAETIIAAERPLKILAVDDDSLVLMNTAALLEDLGHEVIEASSGDEALICFRSHPDLDLLITDQGMPTMSGLQLAAIVRQERADMPIILATGYGELPASADLKLVKLAKPFDQPLLAMALAEATRSDPSAMACRR